MLQGTHTRETRDGAREVKFVLTAARAATVLDWARSQLAADPNGGGPDGDQYRTTTIYLDTDDLAVFRRRGSYGRSKYRIRRYGSSEVAFIERKLRTSRLLSKRRTTVASSELPNLLSAQAAGPRRWFIDRVEMRHLAPICQVSYRRHALIGDGPRGPLRLTFDDTIRVQQNLTTAFLPEGGIPVNDGQVIIEMKFCVEIPAVLKQLVERFGLSPAPVSKYRLAVDALTANSAGDRLSQPSERPATTLVWPSGQEWAGA